MKRSFVAVTLCALVGQPAWAEQARVDLRAIVQRKALELAAFQVPQVPQTPTPEPTKQSTGNERKKGTFLYFVTLAGAVAGSIFNVRETRAALDHHLEARTFPFVWKTTNDPADKKSVSTIIASSNGGLLAAGAVIYMRGSAPLGTFINLLVGGATTIISLHDRSIINDCEKKHTCQ